MLEQRPVETVLSAPDQSSRITESLDDEGLVFSTFQYGGYLKACNPHGNVKSLWTVGMDARQDLQA